MKNLINDTIEKIKKQHIEPEPRWKFLARKYGSWAMFGLVILLASISLSVAWYLISGLDWDLYGIMHQSFFGFSFSIFPYFWAILIVIFIFVAFFDIRKTQTGYRFSWLKIFIITIGSFLIVGILMSAIGFGGRFNNMMNGVPYYAQHMMSKETQWMQPEKGLLSGTIESVSSGELAIKDLNGAKWNIQINEKTLVRPSVEISQGQKIKIIGKVLKSNSFIAIEIRPWSGMGMGAGGGQGQGMGGGGLGNGMMRGGVR